MGRRLGFALLLLPIACPALAETVVLEAVLRGQPGTVSPDGSYELPGTFAEHVFVFDLAAVTDPIVAAKLALPNPPGAFASPQRRETYAVFGVTDGAGHADAGVGARLGAIEVDRSSPATLEIPLEANVLRVLERTNREVALGGRIESLKRRDGSEHLFVGTGPSSGAPAPQLVLETDPDAVPAAAATLHVDDDADPEDADGSAGAPFASLAVALDLAAPGDVVQAAPGVYAERVWLKEGVALVGSGPEESILDATELPEHVVLSCAEGAHLAGFRVRDETPAELTIGVFVLPLVECDAQTELTGNVFEASLPRAVALRGSGVWLHHNEIRGTLTIATEDARIEDNRIEAPDAAIWVGDLFGGGEGSARIARNLVRGKVMREPDFPIRCGSSSDSIHLEVVGNVFLPPLGPPIEGGGGVDLADCLRGDVLHNTFYGTGGVRVRTSARIANNLLVNGAAGVRVEAGASVVIRSNDAFGNHGGVMGAATDWVGFTPVPGDGNVSVDPQFVDAFLADFRLRPSSPALDAGSNDEDDVGGDADFDGDPRVADGDDDGEAHADMGAQELQPGEALPLPPLPIAVDVLPGRSANELQLAKVQRGTGKIAVAILSAEEIDAPAEIDTSTLILERETALRCRPKDVDRDGAADLLCSFPLSAVSSRHWPIFVPPVCVRGKTHAGRKLLGCDEVELLP